MTNIDGPTNMNIDGADMTGMGFNQNVDPCFVGEGLNDDENDPEKAQ